MRRPRLTIRLEDQLIILVVVVIVAVTATVAGFTINRDRAALVLEMKAKAMGLANMVAISRADQILKKDYVALQQAVEEVRENEPNIAYIAILNAEGRIMARGTSRMVAESTCRSIEQALARDIDIGVGPRMESLSQLGGESFYDLVMPIQRSEGTIGAVRIGFSSERVQARIAEARDRYIILGAVFLCLGITGALFTGRILNSQITQFLTSRQGGAGGPSREAPVLREYLSEAGTRLQGFARKLSSEELYTLDKVASRLDTALDFEDALKLGADATGSIMKVQGLVLFLRDEASGELEARIGYNANGLISPEDLADIKVKAGRGEIWMAAEFGTSSLIDEPKPGSAIIAPLTGRDKTIGAIEVKHKISGQAFMARDRFLLELLAGLIATSLENVRHSH